MAIREAMQTEALRRRVNGYRRVTRELQEKGNRGRRRRRAADSAQRQYATMEELQQNITGFIDEFYNRPHSALDYLSPDEFVQNWRKSLPPAGLSFPRHGGSILTLERFHFQRRAYAALRCLIRMSLQQSRPLLSSSLIRNFPFAADGLGAGGLEGS